jgi:hypothetical protein
VLEYSPYALVDYNSHNLPVDETVGLVIDSMAVEDNFHTAAVQLNSMTLVDSHILVVAWVALPTAVKLEDYRVECRLLELEPWPDSTTKIMIT